MTRTQVVVVGGGPVGLSTAVGLRRFGIDCLLVERHESMSLFPKGRAVSVRTMEIFRQWALEEDVRRAGLAPEDSLFVFVGDTLLADEYQRVGRTETQLAVASPTTQLICSQDLLEPVLARRARALGADVRFSTTCRGFTANADHVDVDIDGETVRCDYLVGADGAKSLVRQLLGVEMQGPGVVDARSVSILVDADLGGRVADRRSAVYFVTGAVRGAFVAVDNDRRWLLITRPDEEPKVPLTDELLLDRVRRAVGDPQVDLRLVGHQVWQPTALVAERFGEGRVFLAGDAAHLTTPAGGLGMNCGIGDAHNLAWKLAAVIQGWAHPSLLESYETERKPVAEWCVRTSVELRAEPEGPRRAGLYGIVLGYGYESPAVLADGSDPPTPDDPVRTYVPTARPGHRAPHMWLDDHNRSTLDLFGDSFVLLHRAGSAVDGVSSRLRTLGVPLRTYAVGSAADLPDQDGALRALYGLGEADAVLVRPDGHVAWRGNADAGARASIAAVVGYR